MLGALNDDMSKALVVSIPEVFWLVVEEQRH